MIESPTDAAVLAQAIGTVSFGAKTLSDVRKIGVLLWHVRGNANASVLFPAVLKAMLEQQLVRVEDILDFEALSALGDALPWLPSSYRTFRVARSLLISPASAGAAEASVPQALSRKAIADIVTRSVFAYMAGCFLSIYKSVLL